MLMMYRAFCLTAFLLALVLAVPAQNKGRAKNSKDAPPTPFDVSLNLFAVDEKGAHVTDLKIEDLKLFEDGVEQKITSLTRKQPIAHIALLIDNSGSLRTQFSNVVNAAATLTNGLGPENEFTIIRFISSEKIEIVEDWTSDKTKLLTAMKDNLYIEGGHSAVIDALYLGGTAVKDRQKDKSHRYAVVAISDFEDRVSFYDRPALLSLLNAADIEMHAVAIMPDLPDSKRPKAEFLAHSAALSTGGTACVLKKDVTAESLLTCIRGIAFEVSSQYVIGYSPTNLTRNTQRMLKIEIRDAKDGTKRQGIIREGYTVPKNY